jgi:hypothetical protein
MKAWLILLTAAACLPATPARAQTTPNPAAYEATEGGGSLTVTRDPLGKSRFELEAFGANGHSCRLSGSIDGTTGLVDNEGNANPQACKLRFTVKTSSIGVEPSEGDCRYYCGARASFDNTYWLPPRECRPAERKLRREAFNADYRAKAYANAQAKLEALMARCGNFFNWVEIDELRNDLAVTLFHRGHSDACRRVLAQTRAVRYPDADALRNEMPPGDFDNYLPVAQATWHNLALCQQHAPRRR